MGRRVVITSFGIVSSLGSSEEVILESFRAGRTAFALSTFYPELPVCPVEGFNVRYYTGPCKELRYLNRGAQFSVASALAAIKHSGLGKDCLAKAGLFVGAAPNLDIGGEFPEIHDGKMDRDDLQALWILRFLPNTAASLISRLTGIRGENMTVCTACAATLQAIGEAFTRIKAGRLDLALAGGGNSSLSPGGLLAYKKLGALYSGEKGPALAMRPFDSERGGFVAGEGGGFFVLEELERARERGAHIYAEICGYGCSLDAFGMVAPAPDGESGRAAVLSALGEAKITGSEIGLISSHGTSTILNDEAEKLIIESIQGAGRPPVIALKSWTGHCAAACGAVELALSIILMKNSLLPEIRNLREPCSNKIDFIREPRTASFSSILIENFGFGGQNCALVLRGPE
ncbi:MAG TPA: beta-ketoacyl-[acyl-carrier-protein] synthase family protein [Syntrophus sp. (in: bacteria)]|jgi:3-oxoacyl-[acyl-carrier-protein] synthase II|nr:beta-ketoacyl-[acyl-carrier-protein] synthase family protein [Syntrophus sp. (in: bacteria)]